MAIWAPICPAPTTRMRLTSSIFMASWSSLVDRRVRVGPGVRRREGRRGPQDRGVGEAPPHDLQPDRQAVRGEAAGHRGTGVAGHVEREGERDAGVTLDARPRD